MLAVPQIYLGGPGVRVGAVCFHDLKAFEGKLYISHPCFRKEAFCNQLFLTISEGDKNNHISTSHCICYKTVIWYKRNTCLENIINIVPQACYFVLAVLHKDDKNCRVKIVM